MTVIKNTLNNLKLVEVCILISVHIFIFKLFGEFYLHYPKILTVNLFILKLFGEFYLHYRKILAVNLEAADKSETGENESLFLIWWFQYLQDSQQVKKQDLFSPTLWYKSESEHSFGISWPNLARCSPSVSIYFVVLVNFRKKHME